MIGRNQFAKSKRNVASKSKLTYLAHEVNLLGS